MEVTGPNAQLIRHERLLFGVATLAGTIHAIDEVFIVQEAYRAIPTVVLSLAVWALYPRLSVIVRAVASLVFGVFWLGGIWTHWIPLFRDGASEGDWTSFVSVPGALLFIAIGITLLARRRLLQPSTS